MTSRLLFVISMLSAASQGPLTQPFLKKAELKNPTSSIVVSYTEKAKFSEAAIQLVLVENLEIRRFAFTDLTNDTQKGNFVLLTKSTSNPRLSSTFTIKVKDLAPSFPDPIESETREYMVSFTTADGKNNETKPFTITFIK